MTTMTLSHVTFQNPFVAIVVRSRLVEMDPALEEAAHFTAGAGATTLPILIYASVKRTPDINALSSLLVAACVLGTLAVALLQRPRPSQGD